jgi:glycosyltransferase involved in cell wall biosynthesis
MSKRSTSSPKGPGSPRRVCMIAYTHYRTDGRVVQEAEALVGHGYDVVFFVPKSGAIATTTTLRGVTIRELGTSRYTGGNQFRYVLSYFAFLFAAFLACTGRYLRDGIDVVHVHNMPDFLVFAALIPRLCGCRVVLDVHDTIPETYATKFGTDSGLLPGLLRLEERISCALAHSIIAVNHVQRETLINRGIPANKIAVVMGLPGFAAANRSGHRVPRAGGFRLVNHGTVSPRLGHDLLIRAAEKLAQQIPGFELHIVGAGDGLEDVKRLSESLGLAGCVYFDPLVPWEKLPETLSTMDAGIIANRRSIATELMLPLKLLDYVTLGIPAIAPRLKTIDYYFAPDLVTFFEPGDIDSMVSAVMTLYRDEERRARQPQTAREFLVRYSGNTPAHGLGAMYDNFWRDPAAVPVRRAA